MFCRLRKAFNRVNWVKLLEVLKSIGVDWQDRRLIERLYKGQKARVRLKDGLSEPAVIGCGTRQGSLLSPILFSIIYYEVMLRDALSGVNEGIRVGGLLIKTVRFADDQATLATSVKGQQLMMDKMQETAGEYRKMISVKKTN